MNYLRENIPLEIPELEIVGDPHTCVVAFTFKKNIKKNIYGVEVALKQKKWVVVAIHKPACIHISMTLPFSENHLEFLKDLKWAVKEVNKL